MSKNKIKKSTSQSEPDEKRDYKNFIIEPVDIAYGSNTVLENTRLVIKYGEHYGLIGKNGIGKTSLLYAISERRLDIPKKTDIIYVKQEEPENDQIVIDVLMASDPIIYSKNKRLLELEKLMDDEESEISDDVIEEMDLLSRELGSDGIKAKIRAQKILIGLGFSIDDQQKRVKDFSGGWRMRISLAKALYMVPTLLILDEPTNHLDLHANIWLTSYLKTYPKTLIVVSHDQYFIDEVCTTIVHIHDKKLHYYVGNYDKFNKQHEKELEKIAKDWKKSEKKIEEMRKVGKTGKEINEFIKTNNIIRPEREYEVKIKFLDPNDIKGNFVILEDVDFGYVNQGKGLLYKNLNLEIKHNSRIAIVGKNGIGKSTLLKLITGDLSPLNGSVIKNSAIKIGYYNQHFEDSLPSDLNGIEYLRQLNLDIDLTTSHKYLSMFGLEPIHHKTLIGELSGGQKARVKFASFGVTKPHLLILDEPSNHLDIVAIDALINAINNFNGAVILVTHNFDLIMKINCELGVVDEGGFYMYDGDYDEYVSEIIEEVED